MLAFPGCALPNPYTDEPAPFGGLVLRPGTWLYHQPPGGYSDAVQVVRIEDDGGPVAYSLSGGMRALPRTRLTLRRDGGAGVEYIAQHIDHASLTRMVQGNYREHYGYLEAVMPDPERRAAFVARCAEEPARRAEEARRIEEAKEADRRNIGPWFADLEAAHAPCDRNHGTGYVSDTIEAKVIRRALRELAGVKVKVGVRRYSMASGLAFGGRYSEEDAARVNAIFPGIIERREYRTNSNDYNDPAREVVWEGCSGLHPRAREDQSDYRSDYHSPGGFRVANAYLLDVSRILSEEIERAAK